MLSDTELRKQWQKHRADAYTGLALQQRNNMLNRACYAGNVTSYRGAMMGRGTVNTMVQFNMVQPYVESVAGFMMQHRRKAEYMAREKDSVLQEAYSLYANGTSDYFRGRANADQIESQQLRDVLICGVGAIDTNISYGEGWAARDPNGDIVMECCTDDTAWDPNARAPNLLDATFVYRCRQFELSIAEKLFGKDAEDFEESPSDQGEFKEWNPNGGVFNKIAYDYASGRMDLVNVYYYQWFDVESYWRGKNPILAIKDQVLQQYLLSMLEYMMAVRKDTEDEYTGEDIFAFKPRSSQWIMTPDIKSDVDALCKKYDIETDFIEGKRRCYYSAIISGDRIFKKFKSIDQQGFSIKFITAYWDAINRIWYGMVTALRDPALYYNKALTELMYTIASNSKGGVMVEQGAVDDIATFEQQWAKTNAVVVTNDGAVSGGKIQPKAQPQVNNGLSDIIGIAGGAFPLVTGIDKNFLGSSESKMETASLQRQRIRQITAGLAPYADNQSLYQKEQAVAFLPYMRILAENSDDRLIRLVGKDGKAAFEELSLDGFADEYEIVIAEAPTNASYKEDTADMVMTLAAQLATIGVNIYGTAVDYMEIKESDKVKIRDAINPQPDPQAIAKKQMVDQLQMEMQKAELGKKQADISYAQAGVAERQANSALTFSEAQQKHLENVAIVRVPPDQVRVNI